MEGEIEEFFEGGASRGRGWIGQDGTGAQSALDYAVDRLAAITGGRLVRTYRFGRASAKERRGRGPPA